MINGVGVAATRILDHAEGFVDIDFKVPPDLGDDLDDTVTIWVHARRGDFFRDVSTEIPVRNRLSARIQSDKPIYQPGQIIHLRGVVQDPRGRALEGAKVTLRISDSDGDAAHTAALASSRFGVVQDDWTLPATAGLGFYRIELTAEGDDDYRIGEHTVRVSRYELPTFRVAAKPDRTAYLPGQSARVAITGTYLFGKPVPRGEVKVTRSGEAQWNPKIPTHETLNDIVAQGVAGADGSFAAALDLKADLELLAKSENRRFEDLHFAAYYTDPSSGRTEQRRFDVRITLQEIHVYVIGTGDGTLALPVYVSASYADGTPASAQVELRYQGRVTTLHTNRYGVGKGQLARDPNGDDQLSLRATDTNGRSGTWVERYWTPRPAYLQMETPRTIYRDGESVTIRLSSRDESSPDEFVMLNAVVGERSVAQRIVRLVHGKAEVTFPYQPDFRRTVVFTAWNAGRVHAAQGDNLQSRAVVFPDRSDLRVTATPDRAVYRPGEKATLRVQVSSTDGRPAEAALGLAVVDQSILARERTDSDFGRRPWFGCAFCGDEGEADLGGIRLNDLYRLDASTPISPEMDLAAEALVLRSGAFLQIESGERLTNSPHFKTVTGVLAQTRASLDRHYVDTLEFPKDASALVRILGRESSELRDPWGMPYRPAFRTERDSDVIDFTTRGPKIAGTADDFLAGSMRQSYFLPIQNLIGRILGRTEDFPATSEELRDLLRDNGILLESLRDPWGTSYRADVQTHGAARYITIRSAGPDGKVETEDDVRVAIFQGAYFGKETTAISQAMGAAPTPPRTLDEFRRILDQAGIDVSRYRDAWHRPYRLRSTISSRYGDKRVAKTVSVFGGSAATRTDVIPVTERLITFSLHSDGPDGLEDTYDDFDVARFSVVLSDESAVPAPDIGPRTTIARHGTGAIVGVVTDASGAVVTGATVTLIDAAGPSYETSTGSDGIYSFTSVPVGVYSIRAGCPGFMNHEVNRVPVRADKTIAVDLVLQVGQVAESVIVEASVDVVETSMAATATASQTFTPKVREYFPETLLWIPELVTDSHGAARAQFALADSVTTWKVAVFASTLDGRFAEADRDIRSFQPLFLDFNPPPILTDGDQIELPVTVRNYEEHERKVAVTIQPNEWSTLQGPARKELTVPAGASANIRYKVQYTGANEKLPQRIVALAGRSGDAIEKTIRVHPDGQEVTHTEGDLLAGHLEFAAMIPSAAIHGATHGELRIYPNVASMLLESAGALIETPHGCAEQTISAGYANLIALRYSRAVGLNNPRIDKLALANMTAAADGLAAFREANGGVRYWGTGEPDVAVTAYALNFLVETRGFLPTEDDDLLAMVRWLENQQQPDGRWLPPKRDAVDPEARSVMLTGLVTRALASAKTAGIDVRPNPLAASYRHIARFANQFDDPYLLAQFILAALDSGDEALLDGAAARLAAMARPEKGGLYWDLRANSPFYGWGTAGRFETTGAVISALSSWRLRHSESAELDPVIRKGLVFLLRGRDRFGSWLSTQSTVRAMNAFADASAVLGKIGGAGGRVDIRVNGRLARTISMPDDPHSADPLLVDLSAFLTAGENRVELTTSDGASVTLMRFVEAYWLPWTQRQVRNSSELRLSVQFDRLEGTAGQPVHCSVKAERVGFKGYGMMLAEIGLPPAAEVDRASLESVVGNFALGVDRYDVLPDRVVFYLWPKAGGAEFNFLLRVRNAMAAKSAPSLLYDYYNPEALSEVLPVRMTWTPLGSHE